MTAKTGAQRSAALRKRMAAQQLHEVRCIWAPKESHAAIKADAQKHGAKIK